MQRLRRHHGAERDADQHRDDARQRQRHRHRPAQQRRRRDAQERAGHEAGGKTDQHKGDTAAGRDQQRLGGAQQRLSTGNRRQPSAAINAAPGRCRQLRLPRNDQLRWPSFERDAHEIGGVLGAELVHDARAMNLDGARADPESPASFLVGGAAGDLAPAPRARAASTGHGRENAARASSSAITSARFLDASGAIAEKRLLSATRIECNDGPAGAARRTINLGYSRCASANSRVTIF